MNFLAHYVYAVRHAPLAAPSPAYVLGNALPDLLPLAAPRVRFRLSALADAPAGPLRDGVLMHIRTDAAFHKARSFAQAQADINALFRLRSFPGMRLRSFFLSHVLVELALDAALLRVQPHLVADFYTAFAAADFSQTAGWAEEAVRMPLPGFVAVLSRFARVRYLETYAEDIGVAEGLTRLCARARQDTFTGNNFAQLTALTADAVAAVAPYIPALLDETRLLAVEMNPKERL